MKRKIKIAKNVAKVPERRTKMRRKKREKRRSGRWFCRREIFIVGWGVCVVHVAVRFWERFWKDSKVSNRFKKKCQKGLHNDKNGARKSSVYAGFRALAMWFEYRLSTKL